MLEQGATPSADYILRPWLVSQGHVPRWLDSRESPATDSIAAGDFVVMARYIPNDWARAIDRKHDLLAGLAYFMDDDLLDADALNELPKAYAERIRRSAFSRRKWLQARGAKLWVSTQALADKYASWSPALLPMAPPPDLLARNGAVVIAYHGTASHVAEFEWLYPVFAAVQARRSDTHVELFGDLEIHRRFRGLPRVTVLHPMSWPNYRAYTATRSCDIGLAPLCAGRFNAARGATKFWDYARMNAAGLYSRTPPYADFVRDGIDGILLEPDPDTWVAAIDTLADDPARRQAIAAAARQRGTG